MYDNDMNNILKNFAGAGSGTITDAKTGKAKVNHAVQEKNAMKAILEGLDAQQTSVNQMPSTHKMGKNGAKHPASKFLVGGEFDEERDYPTADDELEEADEPFNNVHNDERVQPGTNVHIGHRTAGGSGVEGKVTRVEDGYVYIKNAEGKTYKGQLKNTTVSEADTNEDTIAQRTPPKTQMNKKQSFKDIFRSMEETEDDMSNRFKKELHDEREERILNKGKNGKFDLAEDEESTWGETLLDDLQQLLYDADNDILNNAESYHLLRSGVTTIIDH